MRSTRVFLILSVFLATSCSNVLNFVLTPFSPDFLPDVSIENGQPVFNHSLDLDRELASDTGPDWKQNYAYYIYRSEISPYTGMRLVGRYYRSESTQLFTDISWESAFDINEFQYARQITTDRDFRLPHVQDLAENIINTSADSFPYFIDTTAPSGTLYYRMSLVALDFNEEQKEVYEGSGLRVYRTYSLSHSKTSGWTVVVK